MPKHYKPRRDYPELPDVDPKRPTIFADPVFDRLCEEFRIVAEQRSEVQTHLEGAAEAYFRNKITYDEMPKAGEKRAALAEIEALAGKLSDRLTRMDPFTSSLFWRPEGEIASYAIQGKPSPYGHKFSEFPAYMDLGVALCAVAGFMNVILMVNAYTVAEQDGIRKEAE